MVPSSPVARHQPAVASQGIWTPVCGGTTGGKQGGHTVFLERLCEVSAVDQRLDFHEATVNTNAIRRCIDPTGLLRG